MLYNAKVLRLKAIAPSIMPIPLDLDVKYTFFFLVKFLHGI